MKFEVITHDNGQITLKKDDEVIIISRRMSRICDIMEDMHANKGESQLLKPRTDSLGDLFGL